jgi:lactoylglutathione lyase
VARVIHSMIRVRDEAASLTFYAKALGLHLADSYAFDGFTLVYLRNDEQSFELELTVNADRTEPYQLGDGYGHLAASVEDIDAEHARMVSEGLSPQPLKTMHRDGAQLARFFFVADHDGYKIEVLQRGGRFE